MIKYQLTLGYSETSIFISLPVTDGNSSALMEFEGGDMAVAKAKFELLNQYGAFGHKMGKVTTGYDLDAALNSPGMARFSARILEGEEIVRNYDPGIPDGAMT